MFIDKVLKAYPMFPKPDAIIKIDNVRDYVYENNQEFWDWTIDAFNIIPPFKSTWFEFKLPKWSNNEGKLIDLKNNFNLSFGVFGQYEILPTKKFCVRFTCFSEFLEGILVNGDALFSADEKGKPELSCGRIVGRLTSTFINLISYGRNPNDLSCFNSYGGVLMMALNFIHCKNVVIKAEQIPGKLKKSRKRKGKPYFEKYYMLQIEPMKKILRTEGESEKVGIKRALHICRGHFRTYNEKKLFGKVLGTFWITDHVRGSEKIGKIHKDYNILRPKEIRV